MHDNTKNSVKRLREDGNAETLNRIKKHCHRLKYKQNGNKIKNMKKEI